MFHAIGLKRLGVGPIGLTVESGECLALTGASGSGKSVLLRMLADLDPHDGEASLDGEACSSMPASRWRRRVAWVPAESGWWAQRVDEHFAAGRDLASSLSELGMPPDAAEWPVARLSTGERQRLALLRAMTPETRVLLLDEPTSGLDADNTSRVESMLSRRLASGAAVVLVTHDSAQAVRMASMHRTMRDGQLEPAA